ncbi:dicarboxylate/amino acid:cation symporter, partial [Phenylobacterium sp.]|uniref:dicarboxylate/amino acid:cation symporter n=1 Tax=Phenylobacterium sp. TaxID=1871053 RepID=UPI002E353763
MNRLFSILIVVAMVLGVIVGWGVHQYATPAMAKTVAGNLSIITDVFLRLIKMIIAPLVFTTLVVGIAHMEDGAAIGRVGGKAIAWFIAASLVSLTLGLTMVHWLQPGVGLNLALPPVSAHTDAVAASMTLKDFVT